MSLSYLIRTQIYNFRWWLSMKLWLFAPKKIGSHKTNTKFTIGVVTYIDRYEQFFIPLIAKLAALFPDTEIIVAINGYYDKTKQRAYLQQIKTFLAGFPLIVMIEFTEPQGLSKLWNLLVKRATADKILILNDDVKVNPLFRDNLMHSSIFSKDVAIINESWSHFLISKSVIEQVGWFDERFTGVGNEDWDYECRLTIAGRPPELIKVRGIKNIVFLTKNFSYGKDTEVVEGKYVRANRLFFDKKWERSDHAAPGFAFVRIMNGYVRERENPDAETTV